MYGNTLVVRDQTGAREVTVPDDFKFTVDGKPMSVHELTPGMKGTAQVTTTTVVRPVTVTTVKKGTVVKRVRDAVYVKLEDGTTRKFTKDELEQRGIQVIMDGKPVRLADLKKGDMLTATISRRLPRRSSRQRMCRPFSTFLNPPLLKWPPKNLPQRPQRRRAADSPGRASPGRGSACDNGDTGGCGDGRASKDRRKA